jgi:hypothetical protein
VYSAFTASRTAHGGQESTLLALGNTFYHWGGAWHVPPIADLSVRDVATRFVEVAGRPAPQLISMSPLDLHNAGLANPIMAQTWEMQYQYQYQRPSILDAFLTVQTFGLKPTPLDDVLRETAEAYS